MNELTRMKLWTLSFNESMFKQELANLFVQMNKEEQFDLLLYCYQKYSDMHPDVLVEIFSKFHDESNKTLLSSMN
jgi:hypothetical protein